MTTDTLPNCTFGGGLRFYSNPPHFTPPLAMPLTHLVRELALQNLHHSGGSADDSQQLGRAVLVALTDAGVDLKRGPSLEEMKALLADITRLARQRARPEPSAA